jgi:hypothetical protein
MSVLRRFLFIVLAIVAAVLVVAGVAPAANAAAVLPSAPFVSHSTPGGLPLVPVGTPRMVVNPLTGQVQLGQPYAFYSVLGVGGCGGASCVLAASSSGGNGSAALLTGFTANNNYQLWYVYSVSGTSWYVLMNAATYRVLQVDPGTIGNNGAKVQLSDYVSGNQNEEWSAGIPQTYPNPPLWDQPIPTGIYTLLDNAATPKVLHTGTAASGPVSTGTVVNMWDYTGANSANNEVWAVRAP